MVNILFLIPSPTPQVAPVHGKNFLLKFYSLINRKMMPECPLYVKIMAKLKISSRRWGRGESPSLDH